MAPSLVQSKSATAASVTSVTVTLTSATTAGNCLVVAVVTSSSPSNPTVSGITLGGAAGNFAQVVTAGVPTTDSESVFLWADPNCSGGQTSVVVTISAASGSVDVIVMEWSGLATSTPVDKTAGQAASAITSWSSGATATTTQASEVAIGVVGTFNGSGVGTITGPGSPWTNLAQVTSASTHVGLLVGYNVLSSTGTPSYAGTFAASSDGAAVIATFKAAAGTTHNASASLTVTPSFSATGSRTRNRTASLTVTPSFTATALKGRSTSAALTVTPAFTAARQASHVASASLVVTPAFTATRKGSFVRSASLTVTPAFSATRAATRHRTAALTITPVLTAAASKVAGAPPGYPNGKLGGMVELYLGTTWTDITTAAIPDGMNYATIKSATPDGAQQPNPASMAAIWDNPDYRFSPRNSGGPYFGQIRQNTLARVSVTSPYGAYLRLEAGNSDRAFTNDTAALGAVTGSLELRIGLRLSDWRGCLLAARYDNTVPSWSWVVNRDGTLTFTWYDSGGTSHSVTSPTAPKVSWEVYRVTLDATNGNVQFFVSTDIDGTWTSMGAAASGTGGAATSVIAGNAPLVVGWSNNLSGSQMSGQVFGLRLYNGIGGSIVADAAFSQQVPGSASWTDLAGRAWSIAGGAELSDKDYRLHGELSSLAPTAAVSGGMARVQTALGGRLRRLQQGSAPVVESPLRRAIRTQAGSLNPVIYWSLEDGGIASAFGPVIGGNLLTWTGGPPKLAADTTFEASAALPQLNGAVLSGTVPAYTGASAWALRFTCKLGSTVPAGAEIARVNVTGGACAVVKLLAVAPSGLQLVGLNGGGGTVFSTAVLSWPTILNGLWVSIEATPSGGNTVFAVVTMQPGGTSALSSGGTMVSGTYGTVTSAVFNTGGLLTDTTIGHAQVQKAWISMGDPSVYKPLNAWRTELAADRFVRVCAEQGITCRLLGRATVTQAMGPQPRGSAWQILRDAAAAEQGIIFEPHQSCFGLGFRTREALTAQNARLTLSFAAANLRGDLQPTDDDLNFVNDLTATMPDGTSYRVTLDDGSAKSVSEPPAGAGRYAASTAQPLNLADASQLASNAAFYLARSSADAARYRNVVADFGIPGAPVKDMARLRPGDLIVITNVPAIYQSTDIHQLAMGATETLGPGRRITWDCVPSSPYGI